jgi:glycerophosphoryl diester phosphodiesterase
MANVTPLPRAHAHNDYAQPRPLVGALEQGFCSIEADVFLVDGKLLVSHDRKDLTPTRELESMYLRPLAARMKANNGSVYATPQEVLLLIDIKADGAKAYEALKRLLVPYRSHLTRYRKGKVVKKGLTLILSGDRPIQQLAKESDRYAFIDGRPENLVPAPGSATLMPLISTSWQTTFKWRGEGEMPWEERVRLHEMVRLAHRRGQKLRFWATPEKPEVWKVLLDAGVDLIGTDKQAELASFLRSNLP